ncbi:MAG TPA: UDP-N-acetylmuramate dehydrogenase [Syntrophomonadaceae bacterium]|nr:UDP-N-acetylmuramate dehydrogenase [Syntrophomonadaceae bacterium]HRX21079.1 UDP-N-acetylmuramate dehydrogenase [Syntrophomonadaceae bacterium]
MHKELLKILPAEIMKFNEPMKNHTTFQIGGPVDVMIIPHDREQVTRAAFWCRMHKVPLFIFGLGSNLLVREKGIRGVAIKIGSGLDKVTVEGNDIIAEAGISIGELALIAADHGLSGMEFAEGIPGSLGGAVVMNAGAYNGEMKDIVSEVTVINEQGELAALYHQDLQFGYRHTILQDSSLIVIAVRLQLTPGDRETIISRMAELRKQRQQKQPLEMPSAGSTFRRPDGFYVGPMLEQLGLKGYAIGGAQVSEKHAGFIVNAGNATADDVLNLITYIQEQVKERFKVDLHTEIRVVGEE